jgi:hypothetical protein
MSHSRTLPVRLFSFEDILCGMTKSGPERSEGIASTGDLKKDLAQIDKLKSDFDVELKASEKSGDFDRALKLKQQIDERVTTLKARVETVHAFEPEPALTVERADLEFAEKLFGKDYLGPEVISSVWGIEVPQEQIPEIPFSQPELERAKELGQFLILRARNVPDGQPLTMLKMRQLLNPKMETARRGKLLVNATDQWKLDSDFFTKDTPVRSPDQDFEWALTAKEILPGSTNKHYVAQTDQMLLYLANDAYKGQRLPDQYKNAVREYAEYRQATFGPDTYEQIQQKLNGPNWQTYADQLTNLKINQLLRHNPAQALYDTATLYQNQDVRLLENIYAWTNAQSAGGGVVSFGKFAAGGANLSGWPPGDARGDLGVLVSRSS